MTDTRPWHVERAQLRLRLGDWCVENHVSLRDAADVITGPLAPYRSRVLARLYWVGGFSRQGGPAVPLPQVLAFTRTYVPLVFLLTAGRPWFFQAPAAHVRAYLALGRRGELPAQVRVLAGSLAGDAAIADPAYADGQDEQLVGMYMPAEGGVSNDAG